MSLTVCSYLCISVCYYVSIYLDHRSNENCLPMVWETGVQSQVKSHQRLKKWYLMLPCLTLSIIRQRSWVKWRNPGNGVAPYPTLRCGSY